MVILGGCRPPEYTIPPVDGPLVVELRHPTTDPVPVTDSIALWGTVGTGRARLRVNGHPVPVAANGGFATFLPLPSGDVPVLEIEASKGSETLRRSIPVTLRHGAASPPPKRVRSSPGWVRLRRLPSDTMDQATLERPVFGRWTPGGDLALPMPLGTVLRTDAGTESEVRVRLARRVAVWVSRAETEPALPPRGDPVTLGPLTLTQARGVTVVAFDAPDLLATSVDLVEDHLRWTLFRARAGQVTAPQTTGGLVRQASVSDRGDGRVVVDLELAAPLLGWRTAWRRGRATLEIRPLAAAGIGLEGLVVALDPGHPPGGATGPTGLTEDSVTLAVALETARLLRTLGAQPILTRSTPEPVSLEARVALAEAAGAEVFVSIHANSPGDGRPPESVDGTRVYWWHPHAFSPARGLRDSVPAATGQSRMGTVQSNLAVLRPTWFPAVLVEITALVMPTREAWLRSAEGVAQSAAGIVGGIQAWQAWRVADGMSSRGGAAAVAIP